MKRRPRTRESAQAAVVRGNRSAQAAVVRDNRSAQAAVVRDNRSAQAATREAVVRGGRSAQAATRAAVVRGGKNEAGYALLFVYMMAACVAIMLYMELPRVAFEAQRDKEQLLIDRGEQYERAIQLYFRKFNQYPATLDALDNTQNIRFIRHRYSDPMTGKNEWRLIHVGPGGAFIDSVLNKGKSVAPATSEKSNLVAEIPLVDNGSTDPNATVNLATRRRASEGGQAAPLDPNAPPPPPDPNANANAGLVGGVGAVPGQTIAGQTTLGQTTLGQSMPGQSTPGQAPQTQGLAAQQNPYAQQITPGAPPASAANLINQLLTSPRPGGLNGNAGPVATPQQPTDTGAPQPISSLTSTPASNTGTPITGTTGQTISGGIAGVASKAEGEGIKLYNDRSKYKEWEFIYDLSKDPTKTGGGQTLPQQGQTSQNGITTQGAFGSSSQQQSTFGSQQQTAAPAPPPPPPPPQQ